MIKTFAYCFLVTADIWHDDEGAWGGSLFCNIDYINGLRLQIKYARSRISLCNLLQHGCKAKMADWLTLRLKCSIIVELDRSSKLPLQPQEGRAMFVISCPNDH